MAATADAADAPRQLAGRLRSLRAGLAAFYQLLPRQPLGASERQARATLIHEDAAPFVRRTAEALGEPGLFEDLPINPDDLMDQQELADVLRDLRAHFQLLDRLCGDLYLDVEAGAARQALTVLRQVRLDGQMPMRRHPRQEERDLALGLARDLAPR